MPDKKPAKKQNSKKKTGTMTTAEAGQRGGEASGEQREAGGRKKRS
jgi:hypothetical protein